MIPQAEAANTGQKYNQPEFAFTGQAARKTQSQAFAETSQRAAEKRDRVLAAYDIAGPNGLTRSELADRLDVPAHHVTSAILFLIRAGRLLETDRTRPSRWGKLGVVLIHSRYFEGADHAAH